MVLRSECPGGIKAKKKTAQSSIEIGKVYREFLSLIRLERNNDEQNEEFELAATKDSDSEPKKEI
jgi:hypothetical protein